nr:alcohol dehydrogenase catalytic domain-containing protein [Verrucomicrobium spinosum]
MKTASAAVVNYAPEKGSVEIREILAPEIGDDDVLLEVANVGVCGSDLHQWTADHSWPVNYPVVLGHEFGGHIVETGKNVINWKEGDRVVSETAAVIDINNPMSRQGLYNLDPTRKGFGYGVNGAMTRYVRVPSRCLHRVPDKLAFEQACLTEPCCVAYNAVVENSRLKPGDRVIVLGPGTIGILCAAVARLCGAEVAWWAWRMIVSVWRSPNCMAAKASSATRRNGPSGEMAWVPIASSMPPAPASH